MNTPTARNELASRSWWLGLALAAIIAVAAMAAAAMPVMQRLGMSALTLAIILGILIGNTVFPAIARHTAAGVDFAKNSVLRLGIILFGLRITLQQIEAVGWAGIVVDALMVTLTFMVALQLGTRVFRLDRQTATLIGAGAAICGAAAVMATEPVARAQPHKVSVAVATVVIFGTVGMFVYPLLYPFLGLTEHAYGMFTGSTVHEVAQVVAAGRSVSEGAADIAVIEKMLRVMMLAPFLIALSAAQRPKTAASPHGHTASRRPPIVIPWFAVLFVAASAINSLHVLPEGLVAALLRIDTVLLAAAMAALGLRTHASAIRQAGARPLLLAASLFVFLSVGGYFINRAVIHLLG